MRDAMRPRCAAMRTSRPLAAALTLALLACRNTPSEPGASSNPAARPVPPDPRLELPNPNALNPGAPSLPSGHPPVQGGGTAAPGGDPHAGLQPPGQVPAPTPSPDEHPLRWTDPPGWRSERPASSMRRAQYAVPGAAGDGELAVFFFGIGQGGDIDENLRRWHGQFERTEAPPTRESRNVGTLRVTVTAASGRFNTGSMGAGPTGPRDDWSLLGAIVETPQGPWFFKLTGPRATLAAARPAFDAMIASMRW